MTRCSPLPRLKLCLISASLILAPFADLHAQEEATAPPASVSIKALETHPIPLMSELPGRVAATRVSEVRARVSGILQERIFQQGSVVKQGDVLYRIDPRLFKVRVQSAEASLQKAKAVLINAQQQFDRQKALRERSVSTGVDYDAAAANLAQANAEVALQQAALDEAKINLDYTEVRAPITGIIGAALVTEGALVTAEGASSLALIQQVNPVYVDFTQSVQDLLALKRAVAEGRLSSPGPGEARVELVFDGGETYPHPGKLLFSNANVDPNTGQVMLRAEFPNDHGDLLPGMYVRVRIEQAIQQSGITVPQRAVTRDADGKPQVYVLGKDNTAQARDVTLGSVIGSEWIVLSGLQAGETVIIDGAQKIKPGANVSPEAWTPPEQPAADEKVK